MTQKAFGRFLLTYDNPYSNPHPNPNTEKRKKFSQKVCELASVSLMNYSNITQKTVGRYHKLVKDDTKMLWVDSCRRMIYITITLTLTKKN